ncbi:hypothetical protein KKC88_02430 [Patescibacteria group bacterium]|nr:hypothetical protein [Patescibacteria group bacterium]MBU1672943.1 hypothetical protein [Patescibacteria group bacterium]
MTNIEQIEKDLAEIKKRNEAVEADKAWEVSYSRRIILLILTYIAIGVYLWLIKVERPWLNAIVPAVAFMLSTLSMPYFKKLWLKIFKK